MTLNLRPLALALAALSLAGALSACAPLVIGGAAVGAMVAVDRRTSGTQLEDESIELRATNRVNAALGERAHVNISSYNRQVLLTGEVPSEQAKQTAERIVAEQPNVRGIINELAVLPPTTITQRSADTLITAKVKASFVDEKELYAGAFRVVTERGVVYLMGLVTPREADKATQIARTINGTQRVVRIFEFITEDELRRITQSPSGASAPVKPAPVEDATPAPTAPPAPVTQPAPVSTAPVVTPAASSSVTGTALPPAR